LQVAVLIWAYLVVEAELNGVLPSGPLARPLCDSHARYRSLQSYGLSSDHFRFGFSLYVTTWGSFDVMAAD